MILTGEKLPWTVELSEWSAFTLHPGSVSRPLMRGLGVTSTVGATVLYNPPTSDLIHSLALCLHLDLRPPLISLSHSQVLLCPTGTALSHSQVQLLSACPTVKYSSVPQSGTAVLSCEALCVSVAVRLCVFQQL